MRFKLVLSVKSESFGSVLPVSYQYELSAAVYRRIRENFELYLHWLSSNGFAPIDDCRNRLFSFSNLYIPRIRVEYDRLHILVKRVQMWISFLPVRGTHEFVKQLFSGETFVLGDRRSRVELEVEDIVYLQSCLWWLAPIGAWNMSGPIIPGMPIVFIARCWENMKRFSVGLLMVIQDFHGVCFPNRKEKEFL